MIRFNILRSLKYYILLFGLAGSCVSLYWLLAYNDNVNMINNGYISKDAISFTLNKEGKYSVESKKKFILYQYNPNSPDIKKVYINGSVVLPPIKMINSSDSNFEEDYLIIGNEVEISNTEYNNYNVVGYFDTSNSYKLDSDTWIVSSEFVIDYNNDTVFVFDTPQYNPKKILHSIFDPQYINDIISEPLGTYTLNSNKVFISIIKITLILLFLVANFIGIKWISKERKALEILFLIGKSFGEIYKLVYIKNFIFLCILYSLILLVTCIVSNLYPIWNISWVHYSLILVCSNILYLFLFSVLYLYFIFKRGGRKF